MLIFDGLKFQKKVLSWLLPVKLVHSVPGIALQKRVRTFENKLFWSRSFVLGYRILATKIIIF